MRSQAAGFRLHQSERSRNHVTENKHGGDTYWDYSLSWYNLVRERVRWWDQKKGERERTAQKRRTLNILQSTFCRHFSAFQSPPSGDRLESRNRHFPPAAGRAKTSACVWSCWEHNSPDPSWLYCQNHWSSVSLQRLIKAAIFPAPSPAGFFCT